MNRFLSPFGLVLLLAAAVYGQPQRDWKVIYSEEFNFIASFPDQPQQTAGDIETSFGKGVSKSWTLELPEIVYEIIVADFPNLSVEMEDKALMAFYKSACADFGVSSGCRTAACADANGMVSCQGYYSDEQFDVLGIAGRFSTSGDSGMFEMYLVKNRLYLAKVSTRESRFKAAWTDIKKFNDEFLFFHVGGTDRKPKWGLPDSKSQNRKSHN
jgi:hypothetical protein